MTLFDLSDSLGDLQSTAGLRRLLSLRGIGAISARRIARRYGSTSALSEADERDLANLAPRAPVETIQMLLDLPEAERLPADVLALSEFDTDWPKWMEDVPDPPAVLYVRGTIPRRPAIAVVGTRRPTEYGLSVVSQVVLGAAARGVGIVSGLAIGIDAAAHIAALDAGLPTWAILGGGVDVPSPSQHMRLAERILAAGGGLLAEAPPGSPPTPQRLVSRNRLQVAASDTVVAAQCGIPSGTLHTVRFTVEQRRRLVVPRPSGRWADDPACAGNLALTDPAGCDPKVLSATGALADAIRARRPVADVVLSSRDDINSIWSRPR